MLDGGPLVTAHRPRAGVGEEVDDDVGRVEVEEFGAGHPDRDFARSLGILIGSTEWIRKGSMMVCNSMSA